MVTNSTDRFVGIVLVVLVVVSVAGSIFGNRSQQEPVASTAQSPISHEATHGNARVAEVFPGAMVTLAPAPFPGSEKAESVLAEVLEGAQSNAAEAIFTDLLHDLTTGGIKLWDEELKREIEFLVEQAHEAEVPHNRIIYHVTRFLDFAKARNKPSDIEIKALEGILAREGEVVLIATEAKH